MTRPTEMAKDLGRALAQTEEYQALKRTVSGTADDRELAELRTELEGLEGQIEAALRAGNEPTEELIKKVYPEAEIRTPMPGYTTAISVDKAKRLLGWKPEVSWRDA